MAGRLRVGRQSALGFRARHVLNDLEALAYGVTVLEPDELAMLQRGRAARRTATRP